MFAIYPRFYETVNTDRQVNGFSIPRSNAMIENIAK